MILQALVDYYEVLADSGDISRPGWAKAKISYAMEIDDNGNLLLIHPLKGTTENSKKPVPRLLTLPTSKNKASAVSSKFLWNNAEYYLGLSKGKPERTKQCFTAAKELHLKLLGELDDPFAKAICAFFNSWDIETAHENPHVSAITEDLAAGENLVFMYKGDYPDKNEALKAAWQRSYDSAEEGKTMRCLITGQSAIPEATHPQIKNVRDAQSSGAAIVSFNAPAFCSYEREQNLNAPVGKYAAFAYTTALNRLLSERNNVVHIGDSTVVFWAESAEEQYPNGFLQFTNPDNNIITETDLKNIMTKLSCGREADWNGLPLKPDNRFYVLGLSPNASRISVRFFLRDNFGAFVRHLQAHYERLEIEPEFDDNTSLSVWKLLRETVNPNANDKKSVPQMSGDVMRAILTGGRYPSTLYHGVQLRILADRKINYTRAAIIKAYLLRNTTNNACREVLTVQLNEDTRYQPYILGRLFSVLEAIQSAANPDIKATIKDKYISAASATPARIFPFLLNLSEKHLRKIGSGNSSQISGRGLQIDYSRQVQELMSFIDTDYPAHHSIEDQGIFQIGYYHQTRKRYEKKDTASNNKEVN